MMLELVLLDIIYMFIVATIPDETNTPSYYGCSVSISMGSPIWFEGHGEVGYTWTIYKINFFDLIEKGFDYIENW